jgi:hypothetical protein
LKKRFSCLSLLSRTVKKRLIFGLLIILLMAVGAFAFVLVNAGYHLSIGPLDVKHYDRGPLYPAVLECVLAGGAVTDDLVQRHLVSVESDIEEVFNVEIDTGGILELIYSGVYCINPDYVLAPGPAENEIPEAEPGYRYARRLSRVLNVLDDYRITAHSVYVTFPAGVTFPDDGETTHNLYNTHLVLPDGEWIESGFGWVTWADGPIIYTYQSYTDRWDFTTVPDGKERDILLEIEFSRDRFAEMHVFDPLSGKSITAIREIPAPGHRVDFSQEQHSFNDTWLDTPKARFHGSRI